MNFNMNFTRPNSFYGPMSFKALVSVVFAVLLICGTGPSIAQDANAKATRANVTGAPMILAAQSARQQCLNVCRIRYRDCLALKQISSFQCRNVYRDCSRIACTNLRI